MQAYKSFLKNNSNVLITMTICFVQIMTYDEEHGSTPEQLDVVIQPVNDEPPIISNTSSYQFFVEQQGPIPLVNSTVELSDNDNCLNHTLIRDIRVTLLNPQPDGEDQLIADGRVLSNYEDIFSCDQEVNGTDCYVMYLLSLEYNNTNPEPGTFRTLRRFVIEV